jgi:hypothetical protein
VLGRHRPVADVTWHVLEAMCIMTTAWRSDHWWQNTLNRSLLVDMRHAWRSSGESASREVMSGSWFTGPGTTREG